MPVRYTSFLLSGTEITSRLLILTLRGRDINTCLELLEATNSRKQNSKPWHLVLSSLLADIQRRKVSANGFVSSDRSGKLNHRDSRSGDDSTEPSPKRKRTHKADREHSPENDASQKAMRQPFASNQYRHPGNSRDSGHVSQSILPQKDYTPSSDTAINVVPSRPTFSGSSDDQIISSMNYQPQFPIDFTNPQDFTKPSPDIIIPQSPPKETDPNYWSDFDYNMADVFQSATWEKLLGPTDPFNSDWTF